MLTMFTLRTREESSMNPEPTTLRSLTALLWRTNKPLTSTGLLMLTALAVFSIGLMVDPRTIAGAPAWLKPEKFALSIAIYSLTLAWIFTMLPAWRRTRTIVGWITTAVMVLELAIITFQAWRGHASHFNVSTPLDGALFFTMGAAIVSQTVSTVWIAIVLFRETFAQRALGAALRAGMVITIVGASSAGLMTTPTRAQIAEVRETGRMVTAGAHTVGAPDGGEGLREVGWSRRHGDLRIPHFFGLHALQVLPLVALIARRRRADETAVRIVHVAVASYVGLFGILLFEALAGEPLLAPGPTTLVLLVVWALVTSAGLWIVSRRRESAAPRISAYAGA